METRIRLNYFIVIFSIVVSYNLNAQSLVKMDNQWNIVVYGPFSPNISSYSIKIGEDTTLNNITYHKVYHSNDSLNTNWKFDNRYLREDSTKKVFLKTFNSEDELLYDFSLEVNDTFFVESHPCILIVTEVDSVMLNNGEVRKRLKLRRKDKSNFGEEYWIDGVGSNFGLINHFGLCYLDHSASFLCFYSNSELLYPESPPSCFITPVKEIKQNHVRVFPNPFYDILYIENEELNIETYIIYDITGKRVKDGVVGLNNQINLQKVKSGFYILVLSDKEGNLYLQKLIKE